MYNRILVPTDGSEVAKSAVMVATELARQLDAALHAVYVVERSPLSAVLDDNTAERIQYGNRTLQTVADWGTEAAIETTTAVIKNGDPVHDAILEYTSENDIELVVMGTQGRGSVGRFMLGSVTTHTVRESHVPVMTVREDTMASPALESILVPFDGSSGARSAVDHAIDLARGTDATLRFVTVVDYGVVAGGEFNAGMVLDTIKEGEEKALESVVDEVEKAGVDVEDASVYVASPFRKIVNYAEENDVDCIVMGTHGRSGIDRVLIGSVTERVIRKTTVPVITTKPKSESA